jgi:molybdenum cofactor biosynthesis enzyme
MKDYILAKKEQEWKHRAQPLGKLQLNNDTLNVIREIIDTKFKVIHAAMRAKHLKFSIILINGSHQIRLNHLSLKIGTFLMVIQFICTHCLLRIYIY